jgi:hypothetical protein
MATTICTSRFYRSHLTSPRGRGSWLFENQAGDIVFMHNGTYSEAKRAAMAYCAQRGLAGLYVCP